MMAPEITIKDNAIRGRSRLAGPCDPRALAAFLPTSISNIAMWLAAYKLTGLNDNDEIASWTDLSGQGHHGVQATATKKPLYKTGIINGLPVARFDGSNDDLYINGMSIGNNTTWVFVFKPSTTTPIGMWDSGPNQTNIFRNYNSGQCEWHNGAPQFNLSLPNILPVTITFVTTLAPARQVVYYRNGMLISTNTNASTTAMTWNNPRIGSVNTNIFYTGDIAEVILYGKALSTDELTSLHAYLNAVYAIW